jgi:copper homeostasis protein
MGTPGVLVEVACESVEQAVAARAAGAGRIELCARLDLEGLTPPLAWVREARAHLTIPFVTMIRSHADGFVYDGEELARMGAFAEQVLAAGSDGIVVGPLHTDRTVNDEAVRSFVGVAAGRDVVFHRAFDAVADPVGALETLVACGVTRVLTSGGAATALEGAERIRVLVDRAAGRIGIVACGRIRAHSTAEVARRTGVTEVHRRFGADLGAPPA